MFQVIICGNIGGNAEIKGDAGREFVTFRVAHNDRYTDSQNVVHDNTQWIDCVINGRPKVLEYLKAGQMVMVIGSASLRIYDSAKDHCKKAGIQVAVKSLELLGSAGDKVPKTLYDDKMQPYQITKYFHTDFSGRFLVSRGGEKFGVDDNGWVVPFEELPEDVKNQ